MPALLALALVVGCIVAVAIVQTRRITRRANADWIDAERLARENAAPLGNADRYFG